MFSVEMQRPKEYRYFTNRLQTYLPTFLKNVLNLAPNEQFAVQQMPLLLSSQHDALSPLLSQLITEQVLV